MENAFSIRRFRPEDREAMVRITIECFDGVSIDQNIERRFGKLGETTWQERKAAQVESEIHLEPRGIFVAEADGQVVGFVTTRLLPRYRTGCIANIAVSKGFQGRGIGKALIDRALAYFREQGLEFARIETLDQNETGKYLYPKLGFQEIARQIYYVKCL